MTAVRHRGALGALQASPYFRGLSEPWLKRLGEAASLEQAKAGEELAVEADGTPLLYLLVDGEVSASTPPDSEGVSELIGQEGPGSVFGSAAITGEEDVPVYRALRRVEAYVWQLPKLEPLFEIDDLRRQVEVRLSLRRRRSKLVELLRRSPLFRDAGKSLLRWLVESATLSWFESGSVVCRQGEEPDAMFLVVTGGISILEEGRPEPLAELDRGNFFGEIALIQNTIRMASAVAVRNTEVLTIRREAFDVLHRRSASFRRAARLLAEMRLEANVAPQPDPELVWLVNDTDYPSEWLAGLVADALREVVGNAEGPRRLNGWEDVQGMLEAARAEDAAFALCFSEATVDGRLGRNVADSAGSVVYVTEDAADSFPHQSPSLHRVHHVVLSAPDGSSEEPEQIRRDAFRLVLPEDETLTDDARAALERIARAIGHRRTGIALGGGAAWGYAHVVLLRGLERAQIPVDMVFGVSMGSIVGAFYASRGLEGLDCLVDAKLELTAAALAAIGTTSSVGFFLKRHIAETRLEELPLPFATVAVEARTGREKVFRHGSLAEAVRASCSLPGVFGRPLLGGQRYLDAGVRNNVPASYCADADADFIIACDVVPPPTGARDVRPGLRGLALELLQINRLTDTVRSLYWLASDSGRQQAGIADALFAPDLAEFLPWDFHRADAIIEKAEEQLDEWLLETRARYQALSRAGRPIG